MTDTTTKYMFLIYNEWDNGEFMTGATVDLIADGDVIHTERFVASSEDPATDYDSQYWNGRANHASTQARSYAWAWLESMTHPYSKGEAGWVFPTVDDEDIPF